MAVRLTHILYFLLLIYPTSLLGGNMLYGNIGIYIYMLCSLYIIFFSVCELINFKSFRISYDYLVIVSFLFLVFKVCYTYNPTYLREAILLTTTFLFFQHNSRRKILNIFYVFLFFSSISFVLYLISFLISLDLLIEDTSNHKALLGRSLADTKTDYINYGNLLLNRSDGVRDFIRFSSHFLEPSFLWFFGLLFYQIRAFRIVQLIVLWSGIAYFGAIAVGLSSAYYFRSFKSSVLICLLIFVSTYLFSDIISTKVLQFDYMSNKGFFLIPEISLYGSANEIERVFVGLGIFLISMKYGVMGLLLYLLWIRKIFYLKNKITDNAQAVVLIALLIYFFKMPFFIAHFYFVFILSREAVKINRTKHIINSAIKSTVLNK